MNNSRSNHQPLDSLESAVSRREFLKQSAQAAAIASGIATTNTTSANGSALAAAQLPNEDRIVIRFPEHESLYHGPGWESLNPGYWQIKDGALRRRLVNVGDRARRTGFPFHSATAGRVLETEYDPSLPAGVIYRRDWFLQGRFSITATFTVQDHRTEATDDDNPEWRMFQDGYALMGISFGAQSLFESFNKIRHATLIGCSDDGQLHIVQRNRRKRGRDGQGGARQTTGPSLKPGDQVSLRVQVIPIDNEESSVTVTCESGGDQYQHSRKMNRSATEGYCGIVGRGLLDFEVNDFQVEPGENSRLDVGEIDCYSCYPLGDTLKETTDGWQVRFVALFASDGDLAELRISETPNPAGGWSEVASAGTAKVVNHEWRRNTAVIHARLPSNPAQQTLYYTIWKDGRNVTSDPRIGTAATGPGTGLVGDVPHEGNYVGRLPRLSAPYRLCGLSCHAITNGLQKFTPEGPQILGGGDAWQLRDQPTERAYAHLDQYDFQIMVWEDDVWYMELVLYPPSTDDAFKVVTNSICGPTSRWQMMRHWNVINPGDHDYGMDDVKGPEQLAIRNRTGLGQDPSYVQRNFQIVHHLITGDEEPDPVTNPKKWRAWKMPDRDFTLVILDSRLWRSSQDVDIWDDAGWGASNSIYGRTDPTRSLLGEEQYSWFERLLATDSSRLICLTGINGLHTIWQGGNAQLPFDERSRVAADYAGWVKAGADRILELLGGRDGVVTVYGDVHNGCILRNREHRVIECSFGPIGRNGGRAVIPGFGPAMKDWDQRPLDVFALYHKTHANPNLAAHADNDPFYWNFLEMEFDPRPVDPRIGLCVRNLIDHPDDAPRGGEPLHLPSSETGRRIRCRLPKIKTLPDADVRFVHPDGLPIRGTRSTSVGTIELPGLVDVPPDSSIIITAFDGQTSASQVIRTRDV